MTLQEFFAALTNKDVVVTISEKDAQQAVTELTKIYASGYEQLLTTLLARTVDSVTISNQKDVRVVLTAGA